MAINCISLKELRSSRLAALLGLSCLFTGALLSQVTSLGVIPASGSGPSSVLTLRFSDSAGYSYIDQALADIYPGGSGNQCLVWWAKSGNALYLMNQAQTAWIPAAPGSSANNGLCTLYTTGSGANGSGNELDVTLVLSFQSSFAGAQTVAIRADDFTNNWTTGYQYAGNWTVTMNQPSPTVHIDNPLPGGVLAGNVTLQGWALDDYSVINANMVQISGLTSGYATYGSASYQRPDVCAAYPGWPPCDEPNNPNKSEVGWLYNLNAGTLTPGTNQTLTVTAATMDSRSAQTQNTTVVVDSPPTISLTSPALPGSGNSGTFSFAIYSWTGMVNHQWLNGRLGPGTPAGGSAGTCLFSYYPNGGGFALIANDGQSWQWGTLTSGLSNSYCKINTDSTYTPGQDGKSGTLSVDVTFLSGFTSGEQINVYMDTSDDWLQSNWLYAGSWTVQPPPPPPTLYVPNIFITVTPNGTPNSTSTGITATNFTGSLPNAVVANQVINSYLDPYYTYPIAITLSSTGINGSGNGTATATVTAQTGAAPGLYEYYCYLAGPSPSDVPIMYFYLYVTVSSTAQPYTISSSPSGLWVQVDGVDVTTPQTYQWQPNSQHTLNIDRSTQAGGTGTQYVFNSWSGLSQTAYQSIIAGSYTANFSTQYYLTTSASPSGYGTINPGSGWYNSGQSVSVSANPNSGNTFADFSGALSGSATPQNLTMTGPETVTANFRLSGSDRYATPTSVSLNPTGGNSQTATFTADWSDTNGTSDLSFVDIVLTPDPTTSYLASVVNACHIQYYPYYNEIRLDDSAGDGQFPYSSNAGSGNQPLSNGVCIVDAAGSAPSSSGDDETLVVPVTFTQAATYYLWTSATTNEDIFNNWVYFGQWTAPTDPDATPDALPESYPNYLTTLPSLTAACNITGNWVDGALTGSDATATWSITQPDNTLNGSSLTIAYNSQSPCGAETITWNASGTFSSGVASLNTSSPNPPSNACGCPIGTVSATVNFSSCSLGQTLDVVTTPNCTIQSLRQSPRADAVPSLRLTPDASGLGPWRLSGTPVQFTVSPNQILLSTGDQNVQITTRSNVSSVSLPNVIYVTNTSVPATSSGPVSCIATPSIPNGAGTGSASSTISYSPAGCGGMTTAWANVAGTNTTNQVQIIVPPQILIQMMDTEASSIATYPTEEALGIMARNRFGDSVYFPGSEDYATTITGNQFDGIKECVLKQNCITTGTDSQGNPTAELVHAANVFDGSSTVSVGNAKCFFSPDVDGWTKIQVALQRKDTAVFTVNLDPGCFHNHKQFVYKSSIPNNINSSAPAFIFEQYREKLTDPVAIQIP